MDFHKSYRVRTTSENLYKALQVAGFDVLFEDQKERLGVLFAKLNFSGIPYRLIVNERYLDENLIECQCRGTSEVIQVYHRVSRKKMLYESCL